MLVLCLFGMGGRGRGVCVCECRGGEGRKVEWYDEVLSLRVSCDMK